MGVATEAFSNACAAVEDELEDPNNIKIPAGMNMPIPPKWVTAESNYTEQIAAMFKETAEGVVKSGSGRPNVACKVTKLRKKQVNTSLRKVHPECARSSSTTWSKNPLLVRSKRCTMALRRRR